MSEPCRFILWLVEGEPECGEPSVGVSLLGNPCCARHARRCHHPRDTWWGLKLPCAVAGCIEGIPGPTLTMACPLPEQSFKATMPPLGLAHVHVEKAQFQRSEWTHGGERGWDWEQVAGPRPPASASPATGERGTRP